MKELTILLKKLIRTGAGRMRFLMTIIGMSVAILLILSAIQIQANYDYLLHDKSNRDSIANFLVINKVISDQTLGTTTLSEKELKDIGKQDFVESAGLLTPSRFKASIQSVSDRFPFYTDIAFESVPDEFLDVTNKNWVWKENQNRVPIIMPNLFLDFYNFQFSISQGLPQLTPEIVKMVVFRINLTGPNGSESLTGRVIGFSDRIASILVPQSFMEYANRKFSNDAKEKTSRVIIRTRDEGNPKLLNYLNENNLTTDKDKTRFSRYRQIVGMIATVSWITGVVLFCFALLIFTLFIQLTIASCQEEIRLLVTLGISPVQLERFLLRRFFPANLYITGISLLLLSFLQYFLHFKLAVQNINLPKYPSVFTLISAIIILGMVWLVNRSSIRKYIAQP